MNHPDGLRLIDTLTDPLPSDPILGFVVAAVVIFVGVRKLVRALRKRGRSEEWSDRESDDPGSS